MPRRRDASEASRTAIHPSLAGALRNQSNQSTSVDVTIAVDRLLRRRSPDVDSLLRPRRLRSESEAVVHLVFDRMRRHPEARDLLHLEFDVRVDHVVGEDAAARHELAVAVEAVERLVERCAWKIG